MNAVDKFHFKRRLKKSRGSVLSVVFLGIVATALAAGYVLSQTNQDIRHKAAGGPTIDCPLDPEVNDVVVNFTGYVTAHQKEKDSIVSIPASIPQGKYNVTLVAHDNHSEVVHPDQTGEIYRVLLKSGGKTIATSGSTEDIPDDQDVVIKQVNQDLELSQAVDEVVAQQPSYPSDNPNSVNPICALFHPTSQPPEGLIKVCHAVSKCDTSLSEWSILESAVFSIELTSEVDSSFSQTVSASTSQSQNEMLNDQIPAFCQSITVPISASDATFYSYSQAVVNPQASDYQETLYNDTYPDQSLSGFYEYGDKEGNDNGDGYLGLTIERPEITLVVLHKYSCDDNSIGSDTACSEDVLNCSDGSVMVRDPENNCEFPACLLQASPSLSSSTEPTLSPSPLPTPSPLASPSPSPSTIQDTSHHSMSLEELEEFLVGYWPMEDGISGNGELVSDVSGNGFHGITDSGGNSTGMNCSVEGKYGFGCEFDGVDDKVNVADDDSLDITKQISLVAWVLPKTTATQRVVVRKKGAYELGIYLDNTVYANFFGLSDTFTHGGGITTTQNVWNHVAVTFDGEKTTTYVNGQVSVVEYSSGEIVASDSQLEIGSAELNFQGLADEVRVYNRALTSEQVQMLFEHEVHYSQDTSSGGDDSSFGDFIAGLLPDNTESSPSPSASPSPTPTQTTSSSPSPSTSPEIGGVEPSPTPSASPGSSPEAKPNPSPSPRPTPILASSNPIIKTAQQIKTSIASLGSALFSRRNDDEKTSFDNRSQAVAEIPEETIEKETANSSLKQERVSQQVSSGLIIGGIQIKAVSFTLLLGLLLVFLLGFILYKKIKKGKSNKAKSQVLKNTQKTINPATQQPNQKTNSSQSNPSSSNPLDTHI
jgi:hypothetical protein